MRVVLDTNVLVAGLLSEQGPPGWILDLVLAGDLQPVFDERILAEYREVSSRPELKLPRQTVFDLLETFEALGEAATVPPWRHALPDPDNEPFLAAAGYADAILVTGNLKHFPAGAREGVTVLSPREFLEYCRKHLP